MYHSAVICAQFDPRRTISAPAGRPPRCYRPWLEVTAHTCEAILAQRPPRLHRLPLAGLTSEPDEPVARVPCRSLAEAGRYTGGGRAGIRVAARLARPAGASETLDLGPDRLSVTGWRVRVAWYPDGVGPGPLNASEDREISGREPK